MWNGHDTECSISSANASRPFHLVDVVEGRVDLAGQSTTLSSRTINLDTPVGHRVAERCSLFEIDRVPSQLHEGSASGIHVGTCNIRRPVAPRVGRRSPDTSLSGTGPRRVDIVVSCSSRPVVGPWNSDARGALNHSWDKHSFVAGKNCLAKGNR